MIAMIAIVTIASAFMALAIVKDARQLNREYKRIQAEFKSIQHNSIINDEWLKESMNKAFKAL